MIHELRCYDCLPGRLPQVLLRFEQDALPLWREMGIRPLGFWTTLVGENDQSLHYMLAWESLAERETLWARFATDPRWQEARRRSETDGPLVARIRNSILKPALGFAPR
ncbi:NIPSNAP family protein [Aquabacter cavernae]|uniref:NIPSNAP family protein n=1 Tax=Aquabacter cavernae TaxID=2496029 RepID=UPI000F8E0D27|nr:NIPSNAP family protein [Aquabacter cavernae]